MTNWKDAVEIGDRLYLVGQTMATLKQSVVFLAKRAAPERLAPREAFFWAHVTGVGTAVTVRPAPLQAALFEMEEEEEGGAALKVNTWVRQCMNLARERPLAHPFSVGAATMVAKLPEDTGKFQRIKEPASTPATARWLELTVPAVSVGPAFAQWYAGLTSEFAMAENAAHLRQMKATVERKRQRKAAAAASAVKALDRESDRAQADLPDLVVPDDAPLEIVESSGSGDERSSPEPPRRKRLRKLKEIRERRLPQYTTPAETRALALRVMELERVVGQLAQLVDGTQTEKGREKN